MSILHKSAEEITNERWPNWRKVDFSWEGLKSQQIDHHDSLQAYWLFDPKTSRRRDEKELWNSGELIRANVEGKDQVWHIAHLPLEYSDGTPTSKITEALKIAAELNSIILERLTHAVPKPDQMDEFQLRRSRAWFRGVVFLDLDLSFEKFEHPINADFHSAVFTRECSFRNASICGFSDFRSTTFYGSANLSSIYFDSEVNFIYAAFISNVTFAHTIFNVGNLNNVKYLKDAHFANSIFLTNGWFGESTFLEGVNFQRCDFSGETNFNSIKVFKYINISLATFSHKSEFSEAEFLGEINFNSTEFYADAYFYNTTFKGKTIFSDTFFYNNVEFNNNTFEMNSEFIRTNFLGSVQFKNSIFQDDANFSDSIFRKKINFSLSRFMKIAYFHKLIWPNNPIDHHLAFENVVFQGLVEFTDSGFRAFAAFVEAKFRDGVKIDSSSNLVADTQFQKELHASCLCTDREKRLRELEAGCRLIRKEMINQSDKHREQLLYKYELIAKSEQSDTPWFEKWASRAYGVVSDYGSSIQTPLFWLFLIFWFSAQFYAVLDGPGTHPWESLVTGFAVSGSRIFPFGAFEFITKNFIADINGHGRPVTALIVMFLATFQSLAAIVLTFLTGLAMRRRFQIN